MDRRTLARREACLSQAVNAWRVEPLENRVLLATLTAPFFGTTDTMTYKDADDKRVRIVVGGPITAEFIFGRVDEDTNRLILGDLPTPIGDDTGQGRDLFKVYVQSADENAFISIFEIDDQGRPIPFNGSSPTIRVINAQDPGADPITVTSAGGTGTLYLGARTLDLEAIDGSNEADRPILSRGFPAPTAIGVHPASDRYRAGLEVADGVDLGKFLFGGTVTGFVDAGGSMNMFYAGTLLTGDARGMPGEVAARGQLLPNGPSFPDNFFVDGDLRDLIVKGSIGTTIAAPNDEPQYVTGFDMRVTGKLGQISTDDSMMGSVDVVHAGGISDRIALPQQEEIEGRVQRVGDLFPSGVLNHGDFNNDTFDTPQLLGSLRAVRGGGRIEVTGALNASAQLQDYVDYYAVGLRAGQEVVVQQLGLVTNVGVYDPWGRLVATDFADVDPAAVLGQPFVFKAERPGIHRFAIAVIGDADFNGTGGEFGTDNVGLVPYILTIDGVGDIGFGGVIAGDNYADLNFPPDPAFFVSDSPIPSIFVQNGDLGGVNAGGLIFSQGDHTFFVRKGNLRAITANQIGILSNGLLGLGIGTIVPEGDVGLIRSTGGILVTNEKRDPDPLIGAFQPVIPIGGSFQVIDAATTYWGNLVANGNIGTIRAGDMATDNPSWFQVNADATGKPGRIDLIDVVGNMGELGAGGPAITTGPGGNVRYIHVGGLVFRDSFFGGGAPEGTLHQNTDEVRFFDDSGSRITLRPGPAEPNPAFVFGGTNSRFILPDMTVVTYGIRGSGGVALVKVDVTPKPGQINSGSLEVEVNGSRKGASAEIGRISTMGPGAPIILNPATGRPEMTPIRGTGFQQTNIGSAHFARFEGNAAVDVYEVVSFLNPTAPVGTGEMSEIRNTSVNGEIVNVQSGSIGSLHSSGTIGLAKRNTPALVEGATQVANTYPFLDQRTGIRSGHVVSMRASGGIGNVMVTGNIGEIVANANGRGQKTGEFEGINAPIQANPIPALPPTGRIFDVRIGQGILPSGNGEVSKAGIYANIIDAVSGSFADIRGNIVATSAIGNIGLNNGSIINANIQVYTDYSQSREYENLVVTPDQVGGLDEEIFEINRISVSGQNSGIIGANIDAADIQDVRSRGGFGIINSRIGVVGNGTLNSVISEGLGLRGVSIEGGSNINLVRADGKNRNVDVRNYSPRVRYSETQRFDPFFGLVPSRLTDIHMNLGTSATQGKLRRITDTAVIENTTIVGQRTLGRVEAGQIRGASQFNMANQITSIIVRNQIAGLRLTTGRLNLLQVAGNVSGFDGTVAGPIGTVNVGRLFASNAVIRAQGPQGTMGSFIVGTDLAGDVLVQSSFDLLRVAQDVEATSLVRARTLNRREIGGNVFGTIQIG